MDHMIVHWMVDDDIHYSPTISLPPVGQLQQHYVYSSGNQQGHKRETAAVAKVVVVVVVVVLSPSSYLLRLKDSASVVVLTFPSSTRQ